MFLSTIHSYFWQVLLVGGRDPNTSLWLTRPQQGTATSHNVYHSPFSAEGMELAIHVRRGFTGKQDQENPPEISNAIYLTVSKCSHLWERPIDSSSQQVWWIRRTVVKGLFYTWCDEPTALAPAPLHVHGYILHCQTRFLLCFSPAAPPARKSHLQSDFIVCLQTSLQSLPNHHANKQLVIT